MRVRAAAMVATACLLWSGEADGQQRELRIRAARVLDGTGQIFENASVVVSGASIVALDASSTSPVDIDLGPATLLPGLIDVHSHVGWHFGADGRYEPRAATPAKDVLYAAENAYVTLLAGFTTIQSPGQPLDLELREAISRGILPGPRILTSIAQIGPSDATTDELRNAVRVLKKQGADVVKIIDAVPRGGVEQVMTRDQLEALCGEARAIGIRTMVHAQSAASIKMAVSAGCAQIEHGTAVDEAGLRLMAERGVYFDPHVGVLVQNYLRNKSRYLGVAGYSEDTFVSMEQALRVNADMIKKAVRTPGLKLVMGSDAVAGAHGRNADELVARVKQGGQKPMDAIVSATSLAAESIGLGATVGRIARGYDADVIAVDGDPARDITALTRVVFVMRGGKVYKAK
jgi:imidazolonepropionase-like amidohydrolase